MDREEVVIMVDRVENDYKAYREAAVQLKRDEETLEYARAVAETTYIEALANAAVLDGRDPTKAYGTNEADRKRNLLIGIETDEAYVSQRDLVHRQLRDVARLQARADALHDVLGAVKID